MNAITTEQIQEAVREAERERRFWASNYRRLVNEHPNQFVAVVDGRVVAHSSDLIDLLGQARGQGWEPGTFWLRYITTETDNLLL